MSSMNSYLLYTALKLPLQKTHPSSIQTFLATLLLTLYKASVIPIVCSLRPRISSVRLLLWSVERLCPWSAGGFWHVGSLMKADLPVGYRHRDLFLYGTVWQLFSTFPSTKCG